MMMNLKNRYNYDPSQPLSKQYQDSEVFNAYYKCFDVQTNQHLLLSHFKTENKNQLNSLYKKFTSIKEKMGQGMNTKYLTKINDVFVDKDKSLFLILDYVEGESIIDYIGKVYTLDWKAAARITCGIMNGLQELHKKDIVNCFINLENIQIDQNGDPKLSFKCMIYKTIYLSPEFRKAQTKSKEGDLYCLGVCFYRLIYGAFPFKTQKNQELQKLVKEGPNLFLQKEENQFATISPPPIRQILTLLLNYESSARLNAISKLQSFSKNLSQSSNLSPQVYSKLFKSKYINICTCIDEKDQHQYSILNKKQRKLLKLSVFTSSSDQIQKYIKNIVNKFAKINNDTFIKIYQYQIVQEENLVIVYSYCGEGNLLEYRNNVGNEGFKSDLIENSMQSLKKAVSMLESPHKYITNQSVYVKSGALRIKFPDFPTSKFLKSIKKLASSQDGAFIAPQVLSGKQSPKSDSWSLGVLQYWMIFNQMPKFDNKGTVLISKKQNLSKPKILYFHSVLQKDPNTRLNCLDEDQVKNTLKEPQKVRVQSRQQNASSSPNKKGKTIEQQQKPLKKDSSKEKPQKSPSKNQQRQEKQKKEQDLKNKNKKTQQNYQILSQQEQEPTNIKNKKEQKKIEEDVIKKNRAQSKQKQKQIDKQIQKVQKELQEKKSKIKKKPKEQASFQEKVEQTKSKIKKMPKAQKNPNQPSMQKQSSKNKKSTIQTNKRKQTFQLDQLDEQLNISYLPNVIQVNGKKQTGKKLPPPIPKTPTSKNKRTIQQDNISVSNSSQVPIILQSKNNPPSKVANKFSLKNFEQAQEVQAPKETEAKQKNVKKNQKEQPSAPCIDMQKIMSFVVQVGVKLGTLQRQYSKPIRIITKCIIAILFYLFLFYFNFFRINGSLITYRNSYEVKAIQIRAFPFDTLPNVNYTLVTKTPIQTNKMFYNVSLTVLRDNYKCVLNDYSVASNVNGIIKSSGFGLYQVMGFLMALANIILVCFVIAKFDLCKVCSLTNFDEKKYGVLINYAFTNLALISLTSLHYLIYGGLYHLMLEPCLGKSRLPGLEYLMKNWTNSWILRFIWIYIGIGIAYGVAIYFLIKPVKSLNKRIYIVFIVLYFTGVGLRGLGKTYPAHENVFGLCGQLLALIVGVCLFLVDIVFACFSKNRTQHATQENKKNNINIDTGSIIEDFNKTEQYLFGSDIGDDLNQK